MKIKKDPRDVVYNINGVNYVGLYDSKGNYHPPCRPLKNGCSYESKDQTITTVWRGGRMKKTPMPEKVTLDSETVELLQEFADNPHSLALKDRISKRILKIYLNKKVEDLLAI